MRTDVSHIPLCVDLDGTLTLADLSIESLLGAIKRAPWVLIMLPLWFLRGRHHLKSRLASLACPDPTVLPLNLDVLQLIEEARKKGRRTVLVTGSHQRIANEVAEHLQLFDDVIATHEGRNLTGSTKARLLEATFGKGGFDYAGNGKVDLPVWEAAGGIITVHAPASVVKRVQGMGKPHTNLPADHSSVRALVKALRLHQWAKNALLFVPLVTAQAIFDIDKVLAVLLAFLTFGLMASATYIVNDLFDLDADRHHTRKSRRPFAAGTLTAGAGLACSALLLVTAATLAMFLPLEFRLALGTYLITTLLYSWWLKGLSSLDVILLAGLYTLRVIAGALAAGIPLSFWLLAFSMFIFLCLAIVKRVAELLELAKRAGTERGEAQVKGREYSTEDIPILQTLGASSGYLAVLVLALYINSPEVYQLYETPQILWLIAPLLLLWVTRLWMVTTRGYMDEDPIFFAIKDPETWLTAVLTAGILAAATLISL
jgi:4-hydroxybenzoate polyprenyltransferase